MTILKKIDKGIACLENAMLIFGILSATSVLFANVFLRYVMKSGLVWAEEYSRFAIIWIVCGGCGAAVRGDAHMKITAIPDAMKNGMVKKMLLSAVDVAGVVFSAMLLIVGVRLIGSMMLNNQLSPAMEIPLWWIYLSLPVGGGVMAFRFALNLLNRIQEKGGKNE